MRMLFDRPTQSDPRTIKQWNGYVPDFLLLDYNSMKPAAIAEVFGFYTDEYKEKAKEKIAFFSSLDKYDFVYWRKYNGDSIPIWKLKDIQNKLRKK